jgi:hypothetical protein
VALAHDARMAPKLGFGPCVLATATPTCPQGPVSEAASSLKFHATGVSFTSTCPPDRLQPKDLVG